MRTLDRRQFAVTLRVFAGYGSRRNDGGMTTQAVLEAVLIQRSGGDWLAVSAPGEDFRIAVTGADESEARHAFGAAGARWLELAETAKMRANG